MNLWLPAASANSAEVDHLLWALLAISLAVLALVFGLMFRYIVKYRAGSPLDRGAVAQKTWRHRDRVDGGHVAGVFWSLCLGSGSLRKALPAARAMRSRST